MRGLARKRDRQIARKLRMNGSSLIFICRFLKASKSSVYEWVRDLPRPHSCTPKGRWDGKRKIRIIKPRIKKRAMRNGDYLLVTAPWDYEGRLYRDRYCYQHHLVWWGRYGSIPAGHVVHHKNRDKHDNRIENLELVTPAEHARMHGNFRSSLTSKAMTC